MFEIQKVPFGQWVATTKPEVYHSEIGIFLGKNYDVGWRLVYIWWFGKGNGKDGIGIEKIFRQDFEKMFIPIKVISMDDEGRIIFKKLKWNKKIQGIYYLPKKK